MVTFVQNMAKVSASKGGLRSAAMHPLCKFTSERASKFASYYVVLSHAKKCFFAPECIILYWAIDDCSLAYKCCASKMLWEISSVMKVGSHIYSEVCIWKCSQIFCTRYHCWLCKARNVLHSYDEAPYSRDVPPPSASSYQMMLSVRCIKNCTLPSARCQERCHGLKASGAALYHLSGPQTILLQHQTPNIMHLSQPGFSKKPRSQIWTNTIADLIWKH